MNSWRTKVAVTWWALDGMDNSKYPLHSCIGKSEIEVMIFYLKVISNLYSIYILYNITIHSNFDSVLVLPHVFERNVNILLKCSLLGEHFSCYVLFSENFRLKVDFSLAAKSGHREPKNEHREYGSQIARRIEQNAPILSFMLLVGSFLIA
jgi:hypothetical protein